MRVITGGEPLTSIAISPDGLRVVAAAQSGHAYVWDARTGEPLLTLSGVGVGAKFSTDGNRVARVGRDGVAKLWDASSGRELLTLTGTAQGEALSSDAFSPDGRFLATSGDLAVRVDVLPLDDLISLARSRLTRQLTADECRQYLRRQDCPH